MRKFLSCKLVRIKGLEPPRRKASDPKSDVATNYTISAQITVSGSAKIGKIFIFGALFAKFFLFL